MHSVHDPPSKDSPDGFIVWHVISALLLSGVGGFLLGLGWAAFRADTPFTGAILCAFGTVLLFVGVRKTVTL